MASNLQFPYDNRNDYKGRITFKVYRSQTPSVSLDLTQLDNILAAPLSEFGEAVGLTESTPSTAGSEKTGWDTTATNGASKSINTSLGSVTLYLPQSINIPDGVNYEQVELGLAGGLAEAGIKGGMSASAALGKAIEGQISSMVNLLKTNPAIASDAAKLAAVRLASSMPIGETSKNVVGSVFRTSINPQRRQMFRGVNMREFGFTFKLIANSPREAQEIENIIKFFRREMYPESIGRELGTTVGYKFPEPFDISMTYNGKRVGTRIAPSYLRVVDVVYNPSSMGFHIDGKPSEVDLRLTFVEERTLDRQDITNGF